MLWQGRKLFWKMQYLLYNFFSSLGYIQSNWLTFLHIIGMFNEIGLNILAYQNLPPFMALFHIFTLKPFVRMIRMIPVLCDTTDSFVTSKFKIMLVAKRPDIPKLCQRSISETRAKIIHSERFQLKILLEMHSICFELYFKLEKNERLLLFHFK